MLPQGRRVRDEMKVNPSAIATCVCVCVCVCVAVNQIKIAESRDQGVYDLTTLSWFQRPVF